MIGRVVAGSAVLALLWLVYATHMAGQAVAAVVGYSAVRYLGEQHLKECVQVVLDAGLALPPPQAAPADAPRLRTGS